MFTSKTISFDIRQHILLSAWINSDHHTLQWTLPLITDLLNYITFITYFARYKYSKSSVQGRVRESQFRPSLASLC